jgi:rRNA-processing protein FCF1
VADSSDAETAPSPTRFLLDTNAFIALEPFAGQMESGMGPAAAFMRLAMKQGNRVFVHPASRDELVEGKNPDRVRQRLAELAKFETLAEAPVSAQLRAEIGPVVAGSNNDRDLRILAALNANAVNLLVSDDDGLRRRARRIGIGDRVLTLDDAAAMLEDLEPSVASTPPMVDHVESYALDFDQGIFSTIRNEYSDFDQWKAKVQGDSTNRECFVIKESDNAYAAIAILKINEADCDYKFTKPVTKISTFKVGQDFSGNRYGELLLKAVLQSQRDHRVRSAYVEVWDSHQQLIDFLGAFGYLDGGSSTKGERVLVKTYHPRDGTLSALDYHIRYGPPAVSMTSGVFVIPIIERWHDQLFPECIPDVDQLPLPGFSVSTRPWGNALRKAYLCNSPSQQLEPGDAILFYRSGLQAVSVVGVVVRTVRTSSSDEVLNLVGGRTVYGASDIRELASHRFGVLVILFRRDRVIDPPWTRPELEAHDVLKAPPQTVTRVKEAGTQWVHQRLADM